MGLMKKMSLDRRLVEDAEFELFHLSAEFYEKLIEQAKMRAERVKNEQGESSIGEVS